jgi:uncharacterized membrane protein
MRTKQLIVSSIAMLLLDAIYLSSFSNFFNTLVGKIQGTKIKLNIFGAIGCYMLLILGLNYFILAPRKPIADAFLLGLVIYGVYETTNYAILANWNMKAVALDTLWGGILFALTTKITYLF